MLVSWNPRHLASGKPRLCFSLALLLFALLSAQAQAQEQEQEQASPLPEQGHSAQASKEIGAFPSDNPKKWREKGRQAVEIDLYGGPSISNSGGGGLGFRGVIVNRQASQSNFGLKWAFGGGGGFYDAGGSVSSQVQIVAVGLAGVGYYGVKGLKDGAAPHVLADFLLFSIDYIGHVESLYSYTPGLEIGMHGRDAATSSLWTAQVRGGMSFSYVSGALQKIGLNGGTNNSIIGPFVSAHAFVDKHVTRRVFLRLGFSLQDTIDSLSPLGGSRQIIELRTHAYVKVGPTLYTGPEFLYTNPREIADFATRTYVPAVAQYSLTWLIGGAIGGW